MYTEEMLEAMDAEKVFQEILTIFAKDGRDHTPGRRIALMATCDVNIALSLFIQHPDITGAVSVHLNPSNKSGLVVIDYPDIVEFPFDRLGQDDALAVCRAFLYAYHNQESSDEQ